MCDCDDQSENLKRIAFLERKLRESDASQIHVYHFASIGLASATRKKTMGSGIVVTMHYLGGKEVCPSFLIRDGMADETIKALQSELVYSFDLATSLKPSF